MKPIAVVPEPDISDLDSEADIAEAPVEQLIDTSSVSSSSQVSMLYKYLFTVVVAQRQYSTVSYSNKLKKSNREKIHSLLF